MQTEVEEVGENTVRLRVDVPSADVRHAIQHAASDLAESVKIPGFRKGKVPMPVLMARVGKRRVYAEAVESHIGGWFWNAAAQTRVRPVAQPQYDYELPESEGAAFSFTATVPVQPKPELADWSTLEVPKGEVELPQDDVEQELNALRSSVAELVPVEGRGAQEGDTLVVDVVRPDGEAQRDYVVELGEGRLVEELEHGLRGMQAGETKEVAFGRAGAGAAEDDEVEVQGGEAVTVVVTVKEIKEKLLPPLDDDLAKTASEFETLVELRADIERHLREELEEEVESTFRAAAVDALVDASQVDASGPLVEARTQELLNGLVRSLGSRGISAGTYLQVTGQTAEALQEGLRAEASRSVARELVLEAVADRLGIEVADETVEALVREQARESEDDPEEAWRQLRESGADERLREDLRMRDALTRIAAEVKPIPVALAQAREQLWTPEQEKTPTDTKLWTPASKERA